MKEIIDKLNELKILQTDIDWQENIPKDIWDDKFHDYTIIEEGLDVEKHRWYETTTTVVDVDYELIGIRHVSQLYSEMSSVEDVYHTMKFFPMKKVETITYEPV